MALVQLPVTMCVLWPNGALPALPAGATAVPHMRGFASGVDATSYSISLAAGTTLQMSDAQAAKITATFGTYAGPIAKKATADWVVS